MQHRLRVDGDIFENAPRVDADIFYMDKKRCVFKNIRIRVDKALDCVHTMRVHLKTVKNVMGAKFELMFT